jgi:hypothetical protein
MNCESTFPNRSLEICACIIDRVPHHSNALAQFVLSVKESLGLAPHDYFLFLKLKSVIKGKRFLSVIMIKEKLQPKFAEFKRHNLHTCLETMEEL